MRFPLLIFFVLLFFGSSYAQKYINYTEKNNLAGNNVYYIFQDSKGFLWFGTDQGVSKYNGQKFKNFNTKDGLINDDVFVIDEDEEGRIWFGSYAPGLCYYFNDSIHRNKYNDKLIKQFPSKSVKLGFYFDEDGNIHYGDNIYGLVKLSPDGNIEVLGENKINVFEFGNKVITSNNKLKKKNKDFEPGINRISFFKNGAYQFLFENYIPKKYILTRRGSQYVLNIGQDSLLYVHGQIYLSVVNQKVKYQDLPYRADCIYQDVNGLIWIGSRKKGVHVYSDIDLKKEVYHFLDGFTVTHVEEDFQKGIWISTLENGAYHFSSIERSTNGMSDLPKEEIIQIEKGPKDFLFILFSNGELWEYQENKSRKLSALPNTNEIENGLFHFDLTSNTLFVKTTVRKEIISSDYKVKRIPLLSEVNPESASRFFYTTPDGEIFDFRGRGIYGNLNGEYVIKYVMKNEYNSTVSANYDNDTLWLGTLNGLHYITENELYLFENSITESNSIHDIAFYKGEMAVTSDGRGVLIRRQGDDRLISTKYGLTSLKFKSISYDEKGNLYIATNQKIYRAERNNDFKLKSISRQQISLSSNINDIIIVEDILYIGTNKGLDVMNINDLQSNIEAPISYINLTEINGVPTNYSPEKTLNYYENSLVIEFTSISYSEFEDPVYAWRFEENMNWHYSNNPQLYLDRLSPGNYNIYLKSSTIPDVWSQTKSISFRILPPFWMTWWFITISIICAIALIVSSIVWRVKVITEKAEKKLTLLREKNDLELKALRAQMNPHFIFNTITAIQYLIESKQNKKAEYFLIKFSHLLRKVVDKSQDKGISLKDELEILSTYVDLQNLRFRDRIKYEVNIDDDVRPKHILIPVMILQPFIENAIEHGLSKKDGEGKLRIEINKNNHLLKISIIDNGIGREKSDAMKNSKISGRKSVGMSNVSKRIAILNQQLKGSEGSVEIIDLKDENYEATGTQVNLNIKYKLI